MDKENKEQVKELNKEKDAKELNKEFKKNLKDKKISLDTILNIGKNTTLAGREYTVVPVNLEDLYIVTGSKLLFPSKESRESGEIALYLALNVTDELRAEYFYYIVEKYCTYKKMPVTKDMVVEHNWSIRDIGKFLDVWLEVSD